MKYIIEFYEKANGKSQVLHFLEKLRQKAKTERDNYLKRREESIRNENME